MVGPLYGRASASVWLGLCLYVVGHQVSSVGLGIRCSLYGRASVRQGLCL